MKGDIETWFEDMKAEDAMQMPLKGKLRKFGVKGALEKCVLSDRERYYFPNGNLWEGIRGFSTEKGTQMRENENLTLERRQSKLCRVLQIL